MIAPVVRQAAKGMAWRPLRGIDAAFKADDPRRIAKGGIMRSFALMAAIAVALAASIGLSGCGGGNGPGGGDTSGVSGTIVNGNWTANTYVSGDVTVTGSLTIGPGVTVTLGSDVAITIAQGAVFSAIGTPTSPIQFKSAGSAIVWNQIYVEDGAGTSLVPVTMKYCSVSGAGFGGLYAIQVGYNYFTAVVDIENCTIAGNSAGGINAIQAGPKSVIKGNNFYANTEFGLYVNDNVAFDGSNTFALAGTVVDLTNLKNSVAFSGDIASTRTLDILEVPYYFGGTVNVQSGASLTIQPGVTLLFNSNCSFTILAGAKFSAVGTLLAPIAFKPKAASTNWKQIYFEDGAGTSLIPLTMKNCTVTGAGTDGNPYYAVQLGYNYYTVVADIESCTISGNLHGGIWAGNAGPGTQILNNSLSGNNAGSGGIYDIDFAGNTNATYSGNGPGGILINP
jgi:hypothetical protein